VKLPTDHWMSRFDEALQTMTPLLRGGRVTFAGNDYHRAGDAVLMRPPDRHLPIRS
jgi:alkanesulfonate monooxygenase SsuD/methylene tetrahydromethanopterin reductase-like flavin-dependent oxidoreductase (luciferase family)